MSNQLMKNLFGWTLLFVTLSLLVQDSAATPTGHNGLTFYALNANGMVMKGRLSQIRSALKITKTPYIILVLTISKTKTSDKVGNKLCTDE